MGIENRGFASMDPDKRREIARRGGKSAHRTGKAHEWTREEARAASLKRRLTSRQVRNPACATGPQRGAVMDLTVRHSA